MGGAGRGLLAVGGSKSSPSKVSFFSASEKLVHSTSIVCGGGGGVKEVKRLIIDSAHLQEGVCHSLQQQVQSSLY